MQHRLKPSRRGPGCKLNSRSQIVRDESKKVHPTQNWPQTTFKRSRGSGPRAGRRRLHWPAPRHHGSLLCAGTATRFPRTCTCAALPGAFLEAGLLRLQGFAFRNQVLYEDRCSRCKRGYVPKVRSVGFPSVLSSPERQVGAPYFLIDLVGNHFRPGVWNTRGPLAANNRQGTSGVCCQGGGLVGLKGRRYCRPLPPLLGVEMSGLSYPEMEGCRNLLGLLDNDDIMALCDTITNRLVQPEDRQDAIRAILMYSQSVEELLRRKKVHREVIFKYLATQGVIVPPATEKHNLIQHAKDYWKKQLHLKLKETPEPVKTEDVRLFQQQEKEDKKAEKVDFRRLGEEFCHWFFELLNSQNPFLGPPQDEWGPQHFWHDVKLRFYYNTSEQNVIDYYGAEIVSLRLLSLVKEEYLFLSPNLDSHGLKCASSPHGLVMVGVAGTVHRGNTCLGIFEQIFGLIRCPFVENTWKIKFINLRIIGEGSLAPGTLTKPAITFEPSDLEAFYNVITLCGTNEVQLNVRQALDSGTGDQALCSGDEALLNKRELSLPNPLKH
ncbi:uncharacterized protein C3orf38 homolog [Ursus arctos]|uniref:uncharacterized protein C3orf38 homolog n=1 Tax=Ursus arctos TaxID=9644 RepID=UPI002016C5AB|nr:uncharacterized protein C3orf38 homolog [Ursus arctos]